MFLASAVFTALRPATHQCKQALRPATHQSGDTVWQFGVCENALFRMPTLLSIWKKILAYILCGCCNKEKKNRYSGYYNAARRAVSLEAKKSRLHGKSRTLSEPCARSKGRSEIRTCKRKPETWELFNLEKFHTISKNGGTCWLDASLSKIITMTEMAVQKDTLKPISNHVNYSSSAVDFMDLFYQIKDATYEHIDKDNIRTTYKCVAKILDDFCRCIVVFIDEINKKIQTLQEANQSNRPFKVTPEMCCGINSAEYVHQSMNTFVSKMNLEEISRDLAVAHSELFSSQWQHGLINTVERTSETAQRKIHNQLDSIIEQMEPTIKKLLFEGSKTCKSQQSEGLLEYLSQNFLIMHVQLNAHHFEYMLICIWNCSTTNVRSMLNSDKKNSRSIFYRNLSITLQKLQHFLMELDGSKKMLFPNVHDIFSPELIKGSCEYIHQYHLERLSQQGSLASVGVLTVRLYFTNKVLTVEVLNARDIILPTRKLNGKCNPYIKLQILPKEMYKSIGKIKTKVQRNTVYPIFDETFVIHFTAEQCSVSNAVIRFTLKSHSMFTVNGTFLGEAFVMLSQIISQSECSPDAVPQHLLRLTRPVSTGCSSYYVMKDCKSDRVKKFIRKEKHKLS